MLKRIYMIEYIFSLLLGFLGLWISADKTVDNAEKLIKALGIPSFIFGAVFISVSTGLPEIATAIISAYEGVPGLSAGDIIGSSFVNLTLVLGAAVLTAKGISLNNKDLDLVKASSRLTLLVVLVLLWFQNLSLGVIIILLGIYGIFLYQVEHETFEINESGEVAGKTVLLTFLGVLTLLISARLMVHGATNIASILDIPVELIGATVVAVGTGLPELAFETAAIKKGDTSLALGDIFGSTLVNITLTLSILGLISTLSLTALLPVLSAIFLLSILILVFASKKSFSRVQGVFLLIIFLFYVILQFII